MLRIPEKHQEELTSSGQQRYLNRVQWARFYLSKAGFISSSERGVWALTDLGRNKTLTHEESLQVFHQVHAKFQEERRLAKLSKPEVKEDSESPEEVEAATAQSYREQLLKLIKSLSPSGFERLCQRLLREAGFTQVTITGRAGDGGIDGVGILQINP